MSKKIRILLWGIGTIYNQVRNLLKIHEDKGKIKIVGITANVLPPCKMLDGYSLIEREDIRDIPFDYIMILSDKFFKEIVEESMRIWQIPREKFIKYNILFIPELDFNDYICLLESKVSIISNNCWGGIAYQALGMECRSPFKNLFVKDGDYIRLIRNLKYYLNLKLQFDSYNGNPYSERKYPIFRLDDIKIHCNHTSSVEAALNDWNRRVRKVNWDNLFIEMYTEKKEIAKEFSIIEQYNKMICFVPFPVYNHNKLFYLRQMPNYKEFWESVNASASGTTGTAYHMIDLLYYGKAISRMD